jgi:hypothetical protein
MKATELIKKLRDLVKKHGDLQILNEYDDKTFTAKLCVYNPNPPYTII